MPDIILWSGEANPKDVRLRSPVQTIIGDATDLLTVKRRKGWRKVQKAIDPGSFTAHVLYSTKPTADVPFVTRKLRSRRVQTAPDVPGSVSPPPPAVQVSAFVTTQTKQVHGWRKAQSAAPMPAYGTPVYPANLDAAGHTKEIIRRGRLKLSTMTEAARSNVSGTPGTSAQPVSAFALPKQHRRKARRFDIEVIDLISANEAQSEAAWTKPDVIRRHSWRRHYKAIPLGEYPAPAPVEVPVGGHFAKPKFTKSKIKRSEREQIEALVRAAFDALDGTVPEPVAVEAKQSARVQLRQVDYTSFDAAIAATRAILDDLRVLVEVYEAERDDEETLLMLL